MSLIVAKDLVKQYGKGESAVTAIQGITFEIGSGEFLAVMGESGAGKSTLLSILGAMNAPSSGDYTVDGIGVYNLKSERRADFRREYLGFVFQSFCLLPYLTVAENVMLPMAIVKASEKRKRAMTEDALDRVGLTGKEKRLPSEISGGEQERVAIARAIVNEPPIVLADEPTGNLDTKTRKEVMTLLSKLNKEGTTIVMVTHSPECAATAQRILQVSDGHMVSAGLSCKTECKMA